MRLLVSTYCISRGYRVCARAQIWCDSFVPETSIVEVLYDAPIPVILLRFLKKKCLWKNNSVTTNFHMGES